MKVHRNNREQKIASGVKNKVEPLYRTVTQLSIALQLWFDFRKKKIEENFIDVHFVTSSLFC